MSNSTNSTGGSRGTLAGTTPLDSPWAAPADDVAARLGVDLATGLTGEDAVRRLAATGPNVIATEQDRSLVASVLAQLRETMILVLLAAAVLTALTGDFADMAVILLVITVNTAVGVIQERRALGAVAALRAMAAPTARVRRDAHVLEVAATELVPGDVLILTARRRARRGGGRARFAPPGHWSAPNRSPQVSSASSWPARWSPRRWPSWTCSSPAVAAARRADVSASDTYTPLRKELSGHIRSDGKD